MANECRCYPTHVTCRCGVQIRIDDRAAHYESCPGMTEEERDARLAKLAERRRAKDSLLGYWSPGVRGEEASS